MENWFSYSTYGYPVLRNVEEALLNRDPKTSQLVGELATKWELTNPTTWRFTLRQGVKFHDGSPFNAEVGRLRRQLDLGQGQRLRDAGRHRPRDEANAVDEYTLDVATASPGPDPAVAALLLAAGLDEAAEGDARTSTRPKRSGPAPTASSSGSRASTSSWRSILDWWGHTAADAYGAATIKNVTFVARAEQEVRAAMLKTGEAHFARWLLANAASEMPQCAHRPVDRNGLHSPGHQPPVAVRPAGPRGDRPGHRQADDHGDADRRRYAGSPAVGPQRCSATTRRSSRSPTTRPAPSSSSPTRRRPACRPRPRSRHVPRRQDPSGFNEIAETVANSLQAGRAAQSADLHPRCDQLSGHLHAEADPARARHDRDPYARHRADGLLRSVSATITSSTARTTTFDDPQIDAMHKAALPLTGAEREKAYQAIAARVAKNMNIIPIGQPNFYFGLSDAPAVAEPVGRLHPAEGDVAQSLRPISMVPSRPWRYRRGRCSRSAWLLSSIASTIQPPRHGDSNSRGAHPAKRVDGVEGPAYPAVYWSGLPWRQAQAGHARPWQILAGETGGDIRGWRRPT